ncbi:MAG: (2Fe-2S)-binding protein [Rubrivivax sp.]
MRASKVSVMVNGQQADVEVLPGDTLLDVLRDGLGLTGTRAGCRQGACGACHVLVDGRALASCDLPATAVDGRQVVTLEGLDPRLADAFIEEGAAQCGYCIPGMMAAAQGLLAVCAVPALEQVRAALAGHLCRCGVHARVEQAVLRAARAMAAPVGIDALARPSQPARAQSDGGVT